MVLQLLSYGEGTSSCSLKVGKYNYLTQSALMYLVEIIPWLNSEPVVKRKPKGNGGVNGAPSVLDQFLVTSKHTEDEDGGVPPDIVMNEDGTISMGVAEEMESNVN